MIRASRITDPSKAVARFWVARFDEVFVMLENKLDLAVAQSASANKCNDSIRNGNLHRLIRCKPENMPQAPTLDKRFST